MPIMRMLEGRDFGPKAVAVLVEALNEIVEELDLQNVADRERAARIVIELAQAQTTLDAAELRDDAVRLMREQRVGAHGLDPTTPEAFEAIRATLSELDNATPSPGPDGLVGVWLDRATVDRLGRLRGPGESYSDVILRVAKARAGSEPPVCPRRSGGLPLRLGAPVSPSPAAGSRRCSSRREGVDAPVASSNCGAASASS